MKTINIFVNTFPKISESFIYNKIESLVDSDYKINLIVTNKGDLSKIKHRNNLKIIKSPISKSRQISTLLVSFLSFSFWKIFVKRRFLFKESYKDFLFKKGLKIGNPDIIHFEFSGIGFQYLPYFNSIKNVKIVSSFRGTAEKLTPLVDEKRYKEFPFFLKALDVCHCVTMDMANDLEKFNICKDKIFINYPSINVNNFNFVSDYIPNFKDKVNIISVGRLHWIKGIDIALLALSKLKETGVKFSYTIVGEGVEYDKLLFLSKKLNLDKEVYFVGYKNASEVSSLLKQSQIFLLPSYSEGMSNSALEAMCSGIPVISTRSGGMEEAIIHTENGFLFDIGDVEALTSILIDVFNGVYDLDKIRFNANKTVMKKFRLKNQTDKFLELYKSL